MSLEIDIDKTVQDCVDWGGAAQTIGELGRDLEKLHTLWTQEAANLSSLLSSTPGNWDVSRIPEIRKAVLESHAKQLAEILERYY